MTTAPGWGGGREDTAALGEAEGDKRTLPQWTCPELSGDAAVWTFGFPRRTWILVTDGVFLKGLCGLWM